MQAVLTVRVIPSSSMRSGCLTKESCFYKYQIALRHSASAAMGHPLSPAALMQNQANQW